MSSPTYFLTPTNLVAMTIDNTTANICIGGTSAPQELTVSGDILGTGNITMGNSNVYSAYSFALDNSNSRFEIGACGAGGGNYSSHAKAGDVTIRTKTVGTSLIIQNGQGTSDFYLSNNLIGIQNSNPQYEVDVVGTTKATVLRSTTASSNAGVLQVSGVTYLQGNVCTFNAPQTYQLNVGGNAGFFGQVYFHSNIYMSNATGLATIQSSGTNVSVGNQFTAGQLNSTTLSNTGNASLSGTITYIANLSNAAFSALSNNSMFGSNTSVWASNNLVGLSNYIIPISLYGSNTSFFGSNIGIYSSNTANTALTKAIYASNLAVATNFWSNNANTIYSLSNVGVGLTNAVESLAIQGNMSLSNTSSKVILNTSNNGLGIGITPKATLDIAGSVIAYNYSKTYKSLNSSNTVSTVLNWQNVYNTSSHNFIVLEASQLIGNNNNYGLKKSTIIVNTSNFSIQDVTTAVSAGTYNTTLSLDLAASNSTSVQIRSTSSIVTTGLCLHSLGVEILNYSSLLVGNCWLT